jgi:hypothetical protein
MHNYSKIEQKPVLRAHGKYVAQLIQHIGTIEDKEKQNACAAGLTNIMRKKHVGRKQELPLRKCWDDLFVLGGEHLGVEPPFPRLDEMSEEKPVAMSYNRSPVTHRAYGRHATNFLKKLLTKGYDKEKQEVGVSLIAQFMYLTGGKSSNLSKVVHDIHSITKDSVDITTDSLQQLLQKTPGEQVNRHSDRKRHYQKNRRKKNYNKR